MPSVSVVIVNFNAGEHLRACVESLVEHLDGPTWDAVVIDNASSDGSAERVADLAPNVRVLKNATNVGFGTAVNQGVAASSGNWILLLNPDCKILPGLVEGLRTELEAHDRCAIAGPRVLDADGAVQGSARGDPSFFTGLFGRSTLLTRLLPGSALARSNVRTTEALASGERSVEVDWVSGASMLARRQALEAVGGFDERFFLYWEDADLCLRLRHAGFHVRYVPGAEVVHQVGQSSRTAQELSIREFHRSAYLYYATHRAKGLLNPVRWLAWVVLAARCRWKLASARWNS